MPFLYKEDKEDMDTIDEWVNFEILRRGLNGKKEAYREVVDGLSKKLKLSKNMASGEKIRSLSAILKKAVEAQRYFSKMGIELKSLEEIFNKENEWR